MVLLKEKLVFKRIIRLWKKSEYRVKKKEINKISKFCVFWSYVGVIRFYNTYPSGDATFFFSLGTFLGFISGTLGNALGGILADRIGRTKFNIIMLILSGSCSIIIGFFLDNLTLALLTAIVWSTTIVPDSPQYSVMITELTDQNYVGTALTVQTSIGFGISLISIELLPNFVNLDSWVFAFTFLSFGPLIGIISLIKLRKEPDSIKLGQGKK